jgi:hypothetical protein
MSICRSCGARITWLHTTAGANIPVNEDPDPAGNIRVIEGQLCETLKHPELESVRALPEDVRPPLYMSHFATCLNADSWRKKRVGA